MESVSDKFKSFVRTKFKSLRRYCELTGQSNRHGYLKKLLMNNNQLSEHNRNTLCKEYQKAKRVKNNSLSNEISHEDRVKIMNFISINYITASNFCRYNQGISKASLSNITSGVTIKKNSAFNKIIGVIELNEAKKWKQKQEKKRR